MIGFAANRLAPAAPWLSERAKVLLAASSVPLAGVPRVARPAVAPTVIRFTGGDTVDDVPEHRAPAPPAVAHHPALPAPGVDPVPVIAAVVERPAQQVEAVLLKTDDKVDFKPMVVLTDPPPPEARRPDMPAAVAPARSRRAWWLVVAGVVAALVGAWLVMRGDRRG